MDNFNKSLFDDADYDKEVIINSETIFLKKTLDAKKQLQYYWVYRISIMNKKKEKVQLLSREWLIIDKNGKIEQVKGKGVVGEQPIIETDEAYEYTSFVSLNVESGIMQGHYEFKIANSDELFKVKIPAFSLDSDKIESQAH